MIKTHSIEAGWDVGAMDRAADIKGELWIVESANEKNVIVKLLFDKMTGKVKSGYDFEITQHIESVYSKAGKALGFYLRKKSCAETYQALQQRMHE